MRSQPTGVLFLALLAAFSPATARSLELAEIFTDRAVLQQGVPIAVWGTARPGERVEITFAGESTSAVAGTDGRWKSWLPPQAASSEGRDLVVRGSRTLVRRDVLVGEVWLAGGQSNMGSRMQEYAETVAAEFARADNPRFRVYTVPKRNVVGEPAPPEAWLTVSPATVAAISATAYYFGRDLHRRVGVPVGIVVCAWGGTLAENWISRASLLAHPETRPIIERYDRLLGSYRDEADYQARLAAHEKSLKTWRSQPKGPARGPAPKEPMGKRHFQRPGGLHETMFLPVAAYTYRGVIFYQGESNVADGRSFQYRYLLPILVREWREHIGAELPFLNVLLPVIKGQQQDEWAEIRESQIIGARMVPRCETAVVLEYGELNRLHPHGKEGVGARLALLARGVVYGEKILFRGPVFRGHRIEGNRVVLEFEPGGSDLSVRGEALSDFTIAGADERFTPARAEISGSKVIVWSDKVPRPVAVRYGWKNFFEPSLYNREGLPAAPFRTDTFRLKTEGNR